MAEGVEGVNACLLCLKEGNSITENISCGNEEKFGLWQICQFLNISFASEAMKYGFGEGVEGFAVTLCARCKVVIEKWNVVSRELDRVTRKMNGVIGNVVDIMDGEHDAFRSSAGGLDSNKRNFDQLLREEIRRKCNAHLTNGSTKVFTNHEESKELATTPPDEKNWSCEHCSFYFATRNALNQHRRRAHTHIRLPREQICIRGGTNSVSQLIHPYKKLKSCSSVPVPVGDQPTLSFTCDLCTPPLIIGTSKGFYRHKIHCHVEAFFGDAKLDGVLAEQFKDYCNRAFQVELLVAPQQRSRDGNPVILCPLCRKTFTNQYSLRYHLFSEHMNLMREKILELQSKTTPEELQNIELPAFSFQKELRYYCGDCGASFAQDTSLYKHKNHKCQFGVGVKLRTSGFAYQQQQAASVMEYLPELLYTDIEEVAPDKA